MYPIKSISTCIVMISICMVMPTQANATVLTVGPGGIFLTIQDAVDAAQEGDIVLVQQGSYDPVTIDHLGISIVADQGGTVKSGKMTIRNLTAHQIVVLAGLNCGPRPFPPVDDIGLLLENNQGSIRCEDCTFRGANGFYPGREAARLSFCDDAAFIRCTFKGGYSTYDGDGGHGLIAAQAHVTLYECNLKGGEGGSEMMFSGTDGGDGGDGLHGTNSFCFTSGSAFTGGKGGNGSNGDDFYPPGDGGDGGDGIQLAGTLSEGWILDSTTSGGTGGSGGDGWGIWPDGSPGKDGEEVNADPNKVHYLSGTAHQMKIDSPVREREILQLVFQGPSGDHAVILLAVDSDAFFAKGLKGVFLLPISPFPKVMYLGKLIGGSLLITATVPELGTGMEGIKIHTQSYFWNFSGKEILGTAQTLFLLDEGY